MRQAAGAAVAARRVRADRIGHEAGRGRAGVNKMSLYRQFSSKDELILAYLERMDACFFDRFNTSVAKH
ncbi:helix-turn-helix transcriptional regulator, partial [Burkholderia sp. Ac-20349]|nr:helix-turn-helix transcriptional regulator [Burkholderia sp. Ac-20349]